MEPREIRALVAAIRATEPASSPEASLALRGAVFDALEAVGIAPKRKALKSVAKKNPHTVLVYAMDRELEVILFSVPDASIDPRMRGALEAVSNLTFAGPADCRSLAQYGQVVRVLAALGQLRPQDWAVEARSLPAKKKGDLPSLAEVEELHQAWWDDMVLATYGAEGDRLKTGLDERITRAIAIHHAM